MIKCIDQNDQFLLQKIIELDKILHELLKHIEEPVLTKGLKLRYQNPTSLHLQLLKGIRIISGLYSLVVLLENGFVQEMGVLIRTLNDFQTEIEFIHDAHTNKPNEKQKNFVDLFFAKEILSPDLSTEKEKRPTVSRKHIRAGSVRSLQPLVEENRARRMQEHIDDAFSGYVHGEYPHIMELYEGNFITGKGKFRTKGMLGTPRINEFRWQLASCLMRANATLFLIALALDRKDLIGKIKTIRKEVENSEVYKRTASTAQNVKKCG